MSKGIKVRADLELRVALRLPFWGPEGDAVDQAIPELRRYLKNRYPDVKQVRIAYRNPRPELTALLHDVWIVVLPFTPFARKMQELIAEDIHGWLKKRFKRIRKGHNTKPADARKRTSNSHGQRPKPR